VNVSIVILIYKGMGNEIFYFCPMLKNHRLDRILLREGCVIPKKEAICPKVTRWKMLGYSFINFSRHKWEYHKNSTINI